MSKKTHDVPQLPLLAMAWVAMAACVMCIGTVAVVAEWLHTSIHTHPMTWIAICGVLWLGLYWLFNVGLNAYHEDRQVIERVGGRRDT